MLKDNNLKFRLVLAASALTLALILSIFLAPAAGADQSSSANAAAGSADDPLVTLSYINKIFKPQIEKTISDKLKTLDDKLKDLSAASAETQTPANQNVYIMSEDASSSYMLLELTKGQQLRAKSGTLELILRPGGAASVMSEYQTQGIADLTVGEELLDGTDLPVNHSLLIPRADERGVLITSVIAYVMVRGDYEIFK